MVFHSRDLVQDLFPSNFFGTCDIEEERKYSIVCSIRKIFSRTGRLMYVAITRAKRHLHMSYSLLRSNYGQQERCKRSQFISEIPTRLVHVSSENEEMYQPPKKKLSTAQPMNTSSQTGFVTGKNLLNVAQWNKRK